MIRQRLETYRKRKQIFGFCKWRDGQGLLFGRVDRIQGDVVHLTLVDVDGRESDTEVIALTDFVRIEESPAYVERLRLFASLPRRKKVKGQTTTSARVIRSRLLEAKRTGECVRVRLRGDSAHDVRVLDVDAETFDFAEYGDDPRAPTDRRLVTFDQIEELRWRSSGEMLVTAVWRSVAKRSVRR